MREGGARIDARGPPRDDDHREEVPELMTVHTAKVSHLKPFGAFVSIGGYRREGLMHVSQLVNGRRVGKRSWDTTERSHAMDALVRQRGDGRVLPPPRPITTRTPHTNQSKACHDMRLQPSACAIAATVFNNSVPVPVPRADSSTYKSSR